MKEKKVWVNLANKRQLEIKLWEDGSLSIAQVQDGDYIKVPEPFVDSFMDALQGLVGDVQQTLNAVLNSSNMTLAAGMSPMTQYPRCHKCNTIKSPASSWWSCDWCGLICCPNMACSDDHVNGATHAVKWSTFA